MNNKKNGTLMNVLKKVEGKGFYIILSLCVIAIGVSGYVLFFTGSVDDDDFYSDINIGSVFEPDDPFGSDEPVNGEPIGPVDTQPDVDPPAGETSGNEETPDEPVSGDGPDEPAASTAKAIAPTAGEIIKEFSGDQLVYDVTMCDWRTHNGTDFSCTQGDTVFCVRDGTVTEVYEDGLMGHTVTVQHSDGITSSYSGLSSAAAVKKGDKLKMGDAVGTAGGTAIAESSQPYHVHVSVSKDGKYIDVMSLF